MKREHPSSFQRHSITKQMTKHKVIGFLGSLFFSWWRTLTSYLSEIQISRGDIPCRNP